MQSGPWSNGNEGALYILQHFRTEASLLDCWVTYPKHLLEIGELTLQQRCSQCILQPQLTAQYLIWYQLLFVYSWMVLSITILVQSTHSHWLLDKIQFLTRAIEEYNQDNHHIPVCWGCRIYWLHLSRGVWPTPTSNDCPVYDIKPPDGESVALEIWGIWST